KHIVDTLSEKLETTVLFANDTIGEDAISKTSDLKMGEILLLENVRFQKEEKLGDEAFARKLANYADVYVNDAFGTAHRAHASTTVVADFFPNDKMFGYVIDSELKAI